MLAGDFQKALKRLNRNLGICCGDDSTKPAGIYFYPGYGEPKEICGIDKNEVPEFTSYHSNGRIRKGGWRRALNILLYKGYVARLSTYKYFGHWDEHRAPQGWSKETSEIDKAIQESSQKGYWKKDELVDIGREIQKQKPVG